MSQFVDYVLTLGQQSAPSFGYASLGLSLEQYGVNAVQKNVPGAVAPTAAEQKAYSCGDLTPTEVAGRPDHAHLWRGDGDGGTAAGERRHLDRVGNPAIGSEGHRHDRRHHSGHDRWNDCPEDGREHDRRGHDGRGHDRRCQLEPGRGSGKYGHHVRRYERG